LRPSSADLGAGDKADLLQHAEVADHQAGLAEILVVLELGVASPARDPELVQLGAPKDSSPLR
jgi:hypothetical protein